MHWPVSSRSMFITTCMSIIRKSEQHALAGVAQSPYRALPDAVRMPGRVECYYAEVDAWCLIRCEGILHALPYAVRMPGRLEYYYAEVDTWYLIRCEGVSAPCLMLCACQGAWSTTTPRWTPGTPRTRTAWRSSTSPRARRRRTTPAGSRRALGLPGAPAHWGCMIPSRQPKL